MQTPTGGPKTESAEHATARITSLTFNDETSLEVATDSVVIFIGPNNCGKSQALKDIYTSARPNGDISKGLVVPEVRWHTTGSSEALRNYLLDSGRVSKQQGIDHVQLSRSMSSDLAGVISRWATENQSERVAPFVMYADTEQRLAGSNPVQATPGYDQPGHEPLQRLSRSRRAQDDLASVARRAFNRPVFLDRWTGDGQWSLKAGDVPTFEDGSPTDDEYRRIASLPQLRQEGDGVRSFVGILLEWQSSNHQVPLCQSCVRHPGLRGLACRA